MPRLMVRMTILVTFVAIAGSIAEIGGDRSGGELWQRIGRQFTIEAAAQTQGLPSRPGARQSTKPQSAAPAKPMAQAPAGPQRTETIRYDSWTVICRDTVGQAGTKQCVARFQVVDQKQRRVLLAWTISRNPVGVLTTVLQTPTGVQIPKGVELKFGDRPAHKLNYTLCGPRGCQSSIEMNAAMLGEATAATDGKAVVTIVAADGRNIHFNMSIKGIDKAIAAVNR